MRPLGTASVHTDRSKIQLYRFKYKWDKFAKFNHPIDPRSPSVLIELDWHGKEKINNYLEIEI